MKLPDLEVVVLAQDLRGVAVVDDHKSIRAAKDLGVAHVTTRGIVRQLVDGNLVPNGDAIIAKIEATGYIPTRRS